MKFFGIESEIFYLSAVFAEDSFFENEHDPMLVERFDVLNEELNIREALRREEERVESILDILDTVEDADSWNFFHGQL